MMTDAQLFRYAIAEIHKCSNPSTASSQIPHPQMLKCYLMTDAKLFDANAQIHQQQVVKSSHPQTLKCYRRQMRNCSDTQMLKCYLMTDANLFYANAQKNPPLAKKTLKSSHPQSLKCNCCCFNLLNFVVCLLCCHLSHQVDIRTLLAPGLAVEARFGGGDDWYHGVVEVGICVISAFASNSLASGIMQHLSICGCGI